MEMPERIQLIIKSHNLTASSFAEALGIQRSSVSHLLSGRNKPSLDVLQKILSHYPRVNAHWLITGEQPAKDSEISSQKEEKDVVETTEQSERHVAERKYNAVASSSQRKISTVMTLYTDGTFEIYRPQDS